MSKPFCPPNPIDLPIAPCTTPWPACARNCTPSSTANAFFENGENSLLKNPPKLSSGFLSQWSA